MIIGYLDDMKYVLCTTTLTLLLLGAPSAYAEDSTTGEMPPPVTVEEMETGVVPEDAHSAASTEQPEAAAVETPAPTSATPDSDAPEGTPATTAEPVATPTTADASTAETTPATEPAISAEKQKEIQTAVQSILLGSYQEKSVARDTLIQAGTTATDAVLPLLDHPSQIIRIFGILILRDVQDPKAIPALFALLSDDDPKIRFHAGLAMTKITGQDVAYRFNDTKAYRDKAILRWKEVLAMQGKSITSAEKDVKEDAPDAEATIKPTVEELPKREIISEPRPLSKLENFLWRWRTPYATPEEEKMILNAGNLKK